MAKLISTSQAAKKLGISRTAILKKIYSGKIRAKKIGRNYVIDEASLSPAYKPMTSEEKQIIEIAVDKVFDEYGEALRMLGNE